MKKYGYDFFDDMQKYIEFFEEHQEFNVISVQIDRGDYINVFYWWEYNKE